ncbi:MAG: hypothetical protein JXB88_19175, partial [Spirochaetales bacterium]|nr:hypothetical protein [Spirochaetales bacterium]
RILSGSDVITGINYFLLLLIWVVGVANAVNPCKPIVLGILFFFLRKTLGFEPRKRIIPGHKEPLHLKKINLFI